MNAIGGYFGLELDSGKEFHQEAIRLNTGRNAFEYILLVNNYSKVYLPFFTCDVLLEPLKKHQIKYEFYSINKLLEPLFNYENIGSDEVFLYTNYFGLKDVFIQKLIRQTKNIIIDNSQSFYSQSIPGIDTFYSPRKFFGLPDGAYLYSNKKLTYPFEKDVSFDRCSHLLKRIDCDPEEGYSDFVANDANLCNQDIKEMSKLTQSLLRSINYEENAERRKRNFIFLHKQLQKTNKLEITNFIKGVPMIYPYWGEDPYLREKLIESRIFTPTYWRNVFIWADINSVEYKMTKEVIYLPIDQRYYEKDLERILKIILNV